MLKKTTLALLPSLLILGQTNAFAAESSPWKAEVELGYINTTGNTESESVNAKATGEYNIKRWRHTANLESLVTSDTGGTSAEKYLIAEKSDYTFSNDISYAFGQIDYEADRFSGYTYRTTATVGYGHKLINQDTLTLDAEIGAGYRKSELSDTNDATNESIGRGAAKLAWKISPYATFKESVAVDVGSDATIKKSVTSLRSQVNGNLATKLTYTIKNTSDVPIGIKNTDTETAFTLVYSF